MITQTGSTPIIFRGAHPTYSFNHDAGLGDCTLVFINSHSLSVPTPAVTYGGQTMTLKSTVHDSNSHPHEIWGLDNCPRGVHEVLITGLDIDLSAGALTYKSAKTSTNWNQAGPTASNNLTVPITTTINNSALVALGGDTDFVGQINCTSGGAVVSRQFTNSFQDAIIESSPLEVGIAGTYMVTIAQSGSASNVDLTLAILVLEPAASRSSGDFFNFLPV